MSQQKYFQGIDDFMAEHPELNPEWKEFIEPVIQTIDDDFYNFVMSFVFM